MAFSSGDKVVCAVIRRVTKEQVMSKDKQRKIKVTEQKSGPAASVDSHTDVFNVSGLKPAQDPGELIHSGEGGPFDPHGLKWRNKSVQKHSFNSLLQQHIAQGGKS